MTAADEPGVRRLYDDLSTEDLHRRFFSAYRPPPEFFDRMARATMLGGADLVATVHDGAQRVVGEAGYWLLPDGTGEFAITVAADWRGGLGAYLLDALFELAAARGIPTLQADILTENAPMMALVRARGYVTVGHVDWSTVRVALGTTPAGPRWPARSDRPRVLVEVPGGRWRAEAEARAAGLDVMACPGPASTPRCPALCGEPCPLVADADAVVYALRAGDQPAEAVLLAHPVLHPGVPLCLDIGPGQRRRVPGVHTVALSKLSAAGASAQVARVARRRSRSNLAAAGPSTTAGRKRPRAGGRPRPSTR